MTTRWTLTEVATNETWTMPINPDSMSSPFPDRQFKTSYGTRRGHDRLRTFQTPSPAKEWEFGGPIRTQAHHDALEAWSKKPGVVRVTDHLNRTFEVMLTGFEPIDRQPTPNTPWRMRYSMKALVMRRIS